MAAPCLHPLQLLSLFSGIMFLSSISAPPNCPFFTSAASATKVPFDCPHILILSPSSNLSLADAHLDSSTLHVLVPWKVGFEQFVKFNPDSCWLDGLSVEVFRRALSYMQYSRPPLFVLYGSGDETPRYDDMVDMLNASREVDAVVADLTITRERMEKVGFTVPYLASSLVMVTPFTYGSTGTLWDFLKPFSQNLWIILLVCFLATGVVLYLLEDQNPEFAITTKKREGESQATSHGGSSKQTRAMPRCNNPMPSNTSTPSSPSSLMAHDLHPNPPSIILPRHDIPPQFSLQNTSNNLINDDMSSLQCHGPPIYDQASHKRRIMNAYWFTSLCVFQSQRESVRTHLGRFVTIMWLFSMLIFNSSYTASLASLLSAQKRYPTIEGFQALKKEVNISVGCQMGSFMQAFMKKLQMDKHKLKDFNSEIECAKALKLGNDNPNGVGAILDELPYMQILLQSECSFTLSSAHDDELPSFGGFGFAFRKGDPLLEKMSKAILAMAEDGTLQGLQDWKIGNNKRGKCDSIQNPSRLMLRSFGGLFCIISLVYIVCIIWRFSWKFIKSPQGRCIILINQAQPHGSTIQQTREVSLGRRSNRVTDESNIDHLSSPTLLT